KAEAFINEYLRWEAEYYKIARVKGIAVDGWNINSETLEPENIKQDTAPSKECFDIAAQVKALKGNKYAAQVAANGDVALAKQRAFEILKEKIDSYEQFNRDFRVFGGSLTWIKIERGRIVPSSDWSDRIATLDFVLWAWSLYSAYHTLQDIGETQLATRYKEYFDMLRKNAPTIFYDSGLRKIRGQVKIKNPKASYITKDNYSNNVSGYYLDDPYEGIMMAYFLTLFTDLPQSEKDHIWQDIEMQKVTTKWGPIYKGWPPESPLGSPHIKWAFMFLPFTDNPIAMRVYELQEKIRTNLNKYGIPASTNTPGTPGYTQYDPHIFAIYGPFTIIYYYALQGDITRNNYGLAWLLNTLQVDKMQGPTGSGESFSVKPGTNQLEEISFINSADGKMPLWLAIMGGNIDEIRQALKKDGLYDKFMSYVNGEYGETFGTLDAVNDSVQKEPQFLLPQGVTGKYPKGADDTPEEDNTPEDDESTEETIDGIDVDKAGCLISVLNEEMSETKSPKIVIKYLPEEDKAVYEFFKQGFEGNAQKRKREIANFSIPATDTDGVLELTWDEIEGAMYYELQENTENDFTNPFATYYPDGVSLTVENRASGTYYYRIRSWMPNETEPPAWSEVISVEVKIAETADKSVEALKLDLDSEDVNVQIAAAKELYARGEKDGFINEDIMEGIALAREKLVWPRIRKLTMTISSSAHSSAAFKELIVLDRICIQPLRDNLYDEDAQTDTRKWSAHLLGHVGRFEEVFDELLAVMENPDYMYEWWIATEADNGIQDLLSRQPKERLLTIIADKNVCPRLRATTARAFISIADPDDILLINALVERLNDEGEDFRVRMIVVYSLGKIGGTRVVEPLIEALKDDDSIYVRRDAAKILGEIGDTRAVKPLIEALQDKDWSLPRNSVEALGKIGDARAVEPLIKLLKEADVYLKAYSAIALGEIGDASAVEALIEALEDDDSGVRNRSVQALAKIGDARAIEPLIITLKDTSYTVRRDSASALEALNWKPQNQEQQITYLIAKGEWEELEEMDPPPVEYLIEALEYCIDYRTYVIDTLGVIGDARAVEPLIKLWEKLGDSYYNKENKRYIVEALGRIGDARAVALLIEALQDDYYYVRSKAIFALGQIGDARAVDPLIKSLREEADEYLKAYSAYALGKIGDVRAIEPLIEVLGDDDSYVRAKSAEALEKLNWEPQNQIQQIRYFIAKESWPELIEIGAPAVEYLIEALEWKGLSFHFFTIQTLGAIGDVRAVEPLIDLLKDKGETVRHEAASALGQIGDVRAVKPLIEALKDEDENLREHSAEALGKIGDVRAVEVLIPALEDIGVGVRRASAYALEALKWEPQSQTQQIRYLIAKNSWPKLIEIGSPAVEYLIEALELCNYKFNTFGQRVINTLGAIGDVRAVEPLIEFLKDENVARRHEAASALGKIGDVRAVKPLIEALKDKYSDVRRYSAEALGKIGDVRAVEPLIEALKDKDKYVRRYSAEALGKIGDVRAIEPLIEALQDEDEDVCTYSAEALVNIGGARAVEGLIIALEDISYHVRSTSVSALEKLNWKPQNQTQQIRYLIAKKSWPELIEIGFPAVEYLIEALIKYEDRYFFHSSTISTLGTIGDTRAVVPLIELLKDKDKGSSIRSAAASALGQIGDVRAVEPLIEALKDEAPWVRSTAAQALGKLGDVSAIVSLSLLLDDDYYSVNTAAKNAVKNIFTPYIPVNFTVLQVDDFFIQATWEGNDIDKDKYAVSYEIQLSRAGYFDDSVSYYPDANSEKIEVNDQGNYWLRACIWIDGVQSEWTQKKPVVINLPPAVPGDFTVPESDETGEFSVSWAAVTGAERYEIEIARNAEFTNSKIEKVIGTSLDVPVEGEGEYWLRVRSVEGDLLSGWSAAKKIKIEFAVEPPVTPEPPAVPRNFTVCSSDDNGVFSVWWTDVHWVTGYEVEIADNAAFEGARIVEPTSTSTGVDENKGGVFLVWRITVVKEGEYWLRVRSVKEDLSSAWSEAKSVMVNFSVIIPDTPSDFSVPSTDEDGTYQITWTEVSDATKYEVQEDTSE
ncbi:MAG: HEAT repeat domain-containing protein, partial [Candidatus Omnitrophota bacterium]